MKTVATARGHIRPTDYFASAAANKLRRLSAQSDKPLAFKDVAVQEVHHRTKNTLQVTLAFAASADAAGTVPTLKVPGPVVMQHDT